MLTVSPALLTIAEGYESSSNRVCFTVSLNQPRSRDVVFLLELSNASTATEGLDFVAFPDRITVISTAIDTDTTCVGIVINDDSRPEEEEFFTYYVRPLDGRDYVDGPDNVTVRIVDNDGRCIIDHSM